MVLPPDLSLHHSLVFHLHAPLNAIGERKMTFLFRSLVFILFLGLLLLPGMVTAAPSAEIIVDEVNCYLEDAIDAANNGTTVGGCTGSSGPDTIILDVAEVYLFYTLPTITSEITIDGRGNAITGDGFEGVFFVAFSGNLTLDNVTISGGSASKGGAVNNEGQLTVINSTFFNNSASNGGGAIYSAAKITVTNSTFYNNT
ncbi:MAG TPA: hypothetical protein G4N94_10315, partial [Caldilineae bacterium]|nr:hypothetical protein [Caldilineae bacterium]